MESMKLLLQNGGIIVYLLLAELLLALWIFVERFIYYHQRRVDVESFLHGLYNTVRNNRMIEAVAICDTKQTPVSNVARAVITYFDKGETALRLATDEAMMSEIPKLESGLKLLSGLGNTAPVLGLLGTVLGMMDMFMLVEQNGNFTPMKELLNPLQSALLTTALGLVVAVAVHCFLFVLTDRLTVIVGDIEKAASEMTQLMIARDWLDEDNGNLNFEMHKASQILESGKSAMIDKEKDHAKVEK